MTVEELQVLVTANTRDLQRQMRSLTSQLQGVQRQTNTISAGMTRAFTGLKRTLVSLGIGKMIKSMFDLSRTYEAATQQVNRIFRENASAIEAWIDKNATTFGMARADAMEYASIYGNLVKGFESDTKRMSQYTTQLLEATTVIASSTGRTVEDVSERIRSGLLGNTEAIEDLGIYANVAMIKTTDAFKTIANGRTWEQLSYQEQQQIRLMSILEQSAAQFGTSIQQNTNYQLMQLTANLKNIGLNLGNAFMPIVSVVLPVLNSMALALANVTNKIAAFMNALFGTNFGAGAGEVQQVAAELGGAGTGASGLADGMNDAASGADNAGKAAKKAGKAAKGALASFDEINTLSKDSGSGSGSGGSGGGAGGTGGITDTGVAVSNTMSQAAESFADKIKDVMDRLKGLFAEGFQIGLGDDFEDRVNDIKESIQGIKDSLKDIFTDSEVVAAASRLADAIALNLGKVTGSIVSIGTTIAQNLLGGIDKYLAQNSQFIKDRLVGIMNASAEIANLVGDFAVAFADIFTVFGGETAQQITADLIAIFTNSFLAATELALKLGADVLNCIVKPIVDNQEQIKIALENTLKPIETVLGTLSQAVTDFATHALQVYDTYIGPAFDNLAQGISNLLSTILDLYNQYVAPTLQKWANDFRSLYEQHLKPIIFNIIDVVGKLANLISEFATNILEPVVSWLLSGLVPAVVAAADIVWEAISGVIGWILDILDGLIEALEGVIDFLTGVFTLDWQKCWEGIKELVSGLASVIYTLVIKSLTGIVTWLASSFITAWKGAVEGIKNLFAPIVQWFSSVVIEPLKQFFSALWENLKQMASSCWQGIQAVWNVVASWFNSTIITPIKTNFSSAWENIKSLASSCVNGIRSVFQSLKSFITGIISSIKTAFTNLWSNIANGCRNAINGVLGKVESGINSMTDKVNSVTSKVGINIPDVKIPKLARGGFVDGATNFGNFIAGEAGRELVVPLENTSFTDKIATAMGQAVMNAMSVMLNGGSGVGNNGQNVVLEMDGTALARTITPYVVKEMKRLDLI